MVITRTLSVGTAVFVMLALLAIGSAHAAGLVLA